MTTNDSRILIRQALVPDQGIRDLLVVGRRIAGIAPELEAEARRPGTEVVDAAGLLAWPGLVNTHHHIAQSLLKGIPASLNLGLNEWLGAVPYRYWPRFTPETVYVAARIGFAELLASGCTTCADHHYLYHRHTPAELEEAVFQAAAEIGIRLVFCRGAATIKGSHRGMNSLNLEIEELPLSLERLSALIDRHHDPAPDAMTRVVVAPTSLVHSCPPEDLKAFAAFARERGLLLHTHLLEVGYDEQVSRDQYGMSAVEFAEAQDWLGEDVWFAHLVRTDAAAIARLGASGTGIAHCPTSNSRLGSGIAPVPAMEKAGVRISIGVDGSAAAESGSMLNELMLCWLLHRSGGDPAATDALNVLRWGSEGGARVLGFPELGTLAPGKLADIVLLDLRQPRYLGVWEKSLAPLLCGEPGGVRHVLVNGRWRLRDGLIAGLDTELLRRDAARELRRLQDLP